MLLLFVAVCCCLLLFVAVVAVVAVVCCCADSPCCGRKLQKTRPVSFLFDPWLVKLKIVAVHFYLCQTIDR